MKTWSVEILPDCMDDTYLGTHDKCLAYANQLIDNHLEDDPDLSIQLAEIEDENGHCVDTYTVEPVITNGIRA